MFDVILSPNDCDAELYQKIREAASEQNMGPITFQRETLCKLLNIPRNHLAVTQFLLIHQALAERSTRLNIPTRHVLRNYFREYFGLSVAKKVREHFVQRAPLKRGEKRFRVLAFLLTVDAATERDIEAVLGESGHDIIRHNPHLFEHFQIQYDHRYWWRATKQGRQDYVAIAGEVETVKKSKLESTRLELKNLRESAIKAQLTHEQKMISGLR